MKRKLSITVSALFVLTITALLLKPTVVSAFWYGANNPPMIQVPGSYFDPYDLNSILNDGPITQLRVGFFAFNNNPFVEKGVTVYDPDKAWDGYTLLGLLEGKICDDALECLAAGDCDYDDVCGSVLIDMEGEIVREWRVHGFPAKMLPGGSVMGGELPFDQLTAVPLIQQDWCGNPEWRWDGNAEDRWYGFNQAYNILGINADPTPCLDPDENVDPSWCISGFHHDYEREGNPVGYYAPGLKPTSSKGKTLILSNHVPETDTGHISTYRLYDEAIYEVDWDGNALFKWFAREHFNEENCGSRPGCLDMGFDADAKEAIMNTRVGSDNSENATDYQHNNSVSYVGENRWYDEGDLRFHPEYIITDARSSNITFIIARYDHPDGETWLKGDIVWKIGPNYSPGNLELKLGQIIGQHHAHMIPRGLPGEGNMMLFDNQGMAGFGRLLPGLPPTNPNKFGATSRVIEFNPVTLDIVWEYVNVVDCRGPVCAEGTPGTMNRKFFSAFLSSAQRLKNGNTLITEGINGRVFEVTVEGEVVWEHYPDDKLQYYGNPAGSGIPTFVASGSVYRAYRVPESWLPKPNKRTCE